MTYDNWKTTNPDDEQLVADDVPTELEAAYEGLQAASDELDSAKCRVRRLQRALDIATDGLRRIANPSDVTIESEFLGSYLQGRAQGVLEYVETTLGRKEPS